MGSSETALLRICVLKGFGSFLIKVGKLSARQLFFCPLKKIGFPLRRLSPQKVLSLQRRLSSSSVIRIALCFTESLQGMLSNDLPNDISKKSKFQELKKSAAKINQRNVIFSTNFNMQKVRSNFMNFLFLRFCDALASERSSGK